LVIVLLDNDGGGIFHFLPASGEGQEFIDHIATPHGLDFSHAAALYSCNWERAADINTFRACLDRALSADRTTIICVRTSRTENVALHSRIWQSARPATQPPPHGGHPAAPPRHRAVGPLHTPNDLQGHRPGRHRRSRQARPPLPRPRHRTRATGLRPV